MARNKAFAPERQPFRDGTKTTLQLHDSSVDGPFGFLNPTRAHFSAGGAKRGSGASTEEDQPGGSHILPTSQDQQPSDYKYLWRSRDNRKGRHPLLLSKADCKDTAGPYPRRTSHPAEVLKVIIRMFTYFPVWDVSWLVAFIFTWGSIVWCINGFFSFLPLIRPSTSFPGEVLYGAGITAFIGAVLFFEFGSILLMFEAVNENSAGCFGWALEELVSDQTTNDITAQSYQLRPSKSHCIHHHPNHSNFVGRSASTTHPSTRPSDENTKDGKSWQWFPSWSALKSHYFHELGFLASFSQFCGATVFSIAGFTALPGINNKLSQGLLDGIYWAPQVVGGSGFIVSGTLYMLETQRNWYTPSLKVLGWHIAFWNLIGGIGFTLCGALGFAYGSSGAQFQAACSTFWGSFAFLIGSVLQLYESLQKNPVEIDYT